MGLPALALPYHVSSIMEVKGERSSARLVYLVRLNFLILSYLGLTIVSSNRLILALSARRRR